MLDKELIKQEIKRRIENMNSCPFKTAELGSEKFDEGELYAYKQILQFIDSLPEEPASEDLEIEIGKYTTNHLLKKRNHSTGVYHLTQKECDNIARHFAEWQKQKDQETIELAEDHAMLAGMMKEREEMMKDAVECTWGSRATSPFMSDFPNVECGDKVKIVIVKED